LTLKARGTFVRKKSPIEGTFYSQNALTLQVAGLPYGQWDYFKKKAIKKDGFFL